MIRHLVALRFAPETTPETRVALMGELAALAGHIEGIVDFQTRPNISVEDAMVRGYRDLFWFDFRDTAVRDTYLADPVHKAIGARLVETLDGGPDGVLVIDFSA